MVSLPTPPPMAIEPPDGWGEDCIPWLGLHGFAPRSNPPIRSSSYDIALTDPFLLYLKEILGFSFPLSYSKALSRGSWAHKRMEALLLDPPAVRAFMNRSFEARCKEIRETFDSFGVGAGEGSLTAALEREEKDFKCAWGWHEAVANITIPATDLPRATTMREFLTKGSLRLIASELLLSIDHPDYPGTPLVIQIDQLYHDTYNDQLWILDYKTCEEAPRVRLATCGIEFQTQHYTYVFKHLLENHKPLLERAIPNFPGKASFAGMMHLAHQKPSISMSDQDRPFEWVTRTLTRGPRKGQEITEKVYEEGSVPTIELFIERCGRWYKGEGEFLDKAVDRAQNPPVNISFTPHSISLDSQGLSQYHARLRYIHSLLTRSPYPGNFLSNPKTVREYGKIHPFAGFYVAPPIQWPDIIAQNYIIQKFRDDFIQDQPQGVHQCQSPNPQ